MNQIICLPSYAVTVDGTIYLLSFYKDNTPGFHYRVVISCDAPHKSPVALDWLCDARKPSAEIAAYYFQKHHIINDPDIAKRWSL